MFTRLAMIGLLVIPLSVLAQVERQGISVSGEAELSVRPDRMNVWLGIMAKGQDVAALRKEVAEKTGRVRAKLAEYGLGDDSVDTTQLTIGSNREQEWGKQEKDGFFVHQVIKIVLAKFDRYDEIINASIDAGANQIHKTEMDVDDVGKYEKEVIKRACTDARKNAEELAANLGVAIGKVFYVSARPVYVMRSKGDFLAEQGIFFGGPPVDTKAFTPGVVYLKASVEVRYTMESK